MEKIDNSFMMKKKKKFLCDIHQYTVSSLQSAVIKNGPHSSLSSSHDYSQLIKLI